MSCARTAFLPLLLVALFLAPGEAGGDAWVDKYLKQAEEKARAEDFPGAAAIYGKSFARAQDNGDLETEMRLARSMRTSFARLWRPEAGPDGAGRGGLQEVLLTLMGELDPEHGGAWIAAHLLAGNLLLRATWSAQYRYVPAAVKVLEKHAGEKESGKGAAALAEYGRGLLALAEKRDAEAAAPLARAVETMITHRWTDLAFFAGTELAALRCKQGDAKGAAALMARIAQLCPPEGDPAITQVWERVVKARLASVPAEVRLPCEELMAAQRAAGNTGASSSDEGMGGHGGMDASSLLSRRFPGLSKRKPIMQAKRTPEGFLLRQGWDGRFSFTQRFEEGVRHRGNQGLSLAYFGCAVALSKFDLTGREDDPRRTAIPTPFEAFYHLAEGEEYGLLKGGAVEITTPSR